MAQVPLRFTVDGSSPDTLAVSGALLFANAAQALETLRRALPVGQAVTLDLAGIETADSAGLACVLALMAEARDSGGRLRVAGMPDGMRALARVSEVEPLLSAAN